MISIRRHLLLLPVLLLSLAGCVSAPKSAHYTQPIGLFPAEGMVVQRALFTAHGRQFALNGYLALSPAGGQRLIVTETFGNVMADVLVKPDGKVFVMRSSRLFPERYIRKLMVADMQCVAGASSALDCPVTMLETNHLVIDRGGYKVDLKILETKPGPQPANLFEGTQTK